MSYYLPTTTEIIEFLLKRNGHGVLQAFDKDLLERQVVRKRTFTYH